VEAPDDTTVVFTLKEAFAPFLAILTNRCAITDMDAYDATKPIGTGPFKVVEWQRGTGITMEAHDGYWEEGLPKASKVNWLFMPESEPRLLAIQGGEVDIITELPSQQIDSLKESGDIIVDPIQGVTHQYLAFNCAEGPFADVRARKAVAHAIDKEIILEGALWGYGTATNIPFPPSSPWYVEIPDYEHDPEKAKALLAEAGLGDGIELDMPIPNWSPASTVAEIVQADLRMSASICDWWRPSGRPTGRRFTSRASSSSPSWAIRPVSIPTRPSIRAITRPVCTMPPATRIRAWMSCWNRAGA